MPKKNFMRFTLEELGLVDSDPELAFTNLAELASRLISAPVSLVSFVQEKKDRQYFKARVGLDVVQTPLSRSFCKLVVSTGEPLIVDDSLEDLRVRDNPVIGELGVRAYLGVPVFDPDGKPVASLCVIDGKPRRWSGEEQTILEKLGRCVTDAIRLKFEVCQSEALRREQREFTHAISHDVRAPLHTLSWVLEEVVDDHASVLSDDIRHLVELAQTTILRTRQMVDDLLEYSLVNEHLEPDAVDLHEVIAEIEQSLSADIACQDARVHTVRPLPTVAGNRRQLNMLFQNLIGNALKFHRPGEPPCVSVSSRELGDVVEVRVTDNGIGISEKYQRQVFGFCERLHSNDDYEGSGIGLSLVRRVAENHEGSVRIESDGATWTSFIVRLPRQELQSNALDEMTVSPEMAAIVQSKAA